MVFAYFTPGPGFLGGGLIGLSAATLLLLSGDVLCISGLASSVFLKPRKAVFDGSVLWKTVFLASFMLLSNTVLGAHFTTDERWGRDPSIPVPSVAGYILGGAFVGFGTRLSNGCTCGHGICGMARFSIRSIVAVCVFMAFAFGVAAVVSPDNKAFAKGTAFLRTDNEAPELFNRWLGFGITMLAVLPAVFAVYFSLRHSNKDDARQTEGTATVADLNATEEPPSRVQQKKDSVRSQMSETSRTDALSVAAPTHDAENPQPGPVAPTEKNASTAPGQEDMKGDSDELGDDHVRKAAVAVVSGALFACGLAISQMVLPSKVLGFLALNTFASSTYDPTLVTVMIGGVIVSFVSYQFVKDWALFSNPHARQCPLVGRKFSVPTSTTLDWKLFCGAACYGVGWALVGLCPGPAVFLAATGAKPVIFYFWPASLAGSFVASKLKKWSAARAGVPLGNLSTRTL